jgi:Rrf2 family protein
MAMFDTRETHLTNIMLGLSKLQDEAEATSTEFVSSRILSDRLYLSPSHLEQLMKRLVDAELVTSMRGPAGGYRLARDAEDILVLEIIDAASGGRVAPDDLTNWTRRMMCALTLKELMQHGTVRSKPCIAVAS